MSLHPRRMTVSPPRDMDASPFAPILSSLISRIPGAFAAALVDAQGETVDYWGNIDPFDIKVAAAHWQIILKQIAELSYLGEPSRIVVRGASRSVVVRTLEDGYSVVLLISRRGGFAASDRAFSACIYALDIEAGWKVASRLPPWFPITVSVDDRKRPVRIEYGGLAEGVEVLGAVVGLARGEHGFRIRLASGPEITVVREPGGQWYAEERV
ncbi:MAG: roadblock/LC7 domain-containing protein [Polyangiaceae bacterium]